MILSDEQSRIVELSKGGHIVLAPPGTGKTELLARRAEHALKIGIPQEKMVCLTFTNRAAKEMKDRIDERNPGNAIFVGNIHRFCSQFLFRRKLVPSFASLLDEAESLLLLNEIKQSVGYKGATKNEALLRLHTYFSQREKGFSAEVLLPPTREEITSLEEDKIICGKYRKIKTENVLLDFDDLLTLAYASLKNDSSPSPCYSWVQADEAQDLNPLQWEIIRLICEDGAHKVFLGDYEQAIFSFMGAKIERLLAMEKDYELHTLGTNYRSPSYLLEIYNRYSEIHFPLQRRKNAIASEVVAPEDDDLLLLQVSGTKEDEAEKIVNALIPGLLKKSKGQTAILVRTNKSADLYSRLLQERGSEHFKISGQDLFHSRVVKDLLAFLFCLSDERDRASWFRLFHIFGGCASLREARGFVTGLFDEGMLPTDVLHESRRYPLEAFVNLAKNGRVVVFDTETTGLDTNRDDIVQIAAVEIVQGKIGREFEVYLKTDKSLEKTEPIHNISARYLEEHGIAPEDGFLRFASFVGGDPIAAHNLSFDKSILRTCLHRNSLDATSLQALLGADSFDTIDLIRRLFPRRFSYTLADLLEDFSIFGENTHNALDDVKATVNLILHLLPKFEERAFSVRIRFQDEPHLEKLRKKLSCFWLQCLQRLEVPTSLASIASEFLSFLEESAGYKMEARDRENISKLLRHMEHRSGVHPLGWLLKERVPEYRYYREADLVLGDEQIIVSTVHKAKGLQFENVIIPECVDGVYPWWNSEGNKRNEDARVLYVAMSRAMERLILTSHTESMNQWGRIFKKERSPFLQCVAPFFKEGRLS